MKKALIIIDLQNSAINRFTKKIPSKIVLFLRKHRRKFKLILFCKFENTRNSNFVKYLNFKGYMSLKEKDFVSEIKDYLQFGRISKRNTFSIFGDVANQKLFKKLGIRELYFCGLDTDACVLTSAMDAFDRGYKVFIFSDLCGSSGDERLHRDAPRLLKRNIKNVIKTSEF